MTLAKTVAAKATAVRAGSAARGGRKATGFATGIAGRSGCRVARWRRGASCRESSGAVCFCWGNRRVRRGIGGGSSRIACRSGSSRIACRSSAARRCKCLTRKQTGNRHSYSGEKIELFHNHTHCPKNLFAFPTLPASDRTNVIYKYFCPFFLRL